MKGLVLIITGLALGVAGTLGHQHLTSHPQEHHAYAGQQTRQVSSLSADDIADLSAGRGWGLAKPAELNGYPGPAHVLELADELVLSAAQRESARRTFREMQDRAKDLGRALIDAEADIDALFTTSAASSAALDERLAAAEALRRRLRATHLIAHLEMTPVLTLEQRTIYSRLRGYEHGHGNH